MKPAVTSSLLPSPGFGRWIWSAPPAVWRVIVWALFAGILASNGRAADNEVTVFAAISLAESLKEIAGQLETNGGPRLVLNLGASSLLARQIGEGAPADIFFSADEAKMEGLARAGRIVPATRRAPLGNQLVVVTPIRDAVPIRATADLAGTNVHRISMAGPRSVPAGIYARAYLERQKLWEAVSPKVVPTENVRAALAVVESGDVDAGIVYKTDAAMATRIQVVLEIPLSDTPEIRYSVAMVDPAPHAAAARRFLDYLQTAQSSDTFRRHGFIVLK